VQSKKTKTQNKVKTIKVCLQRKRQYRSCDWIAFALAVFSRHAIVDSATFWLSKRYIIVKVFGRISTTISALLQQFVFNLLTKDNYNDLYTTIDEK